MSHARGDDPGRVAKSETPEVPGAPGPAGSGPGPGSAELPPRAKARKLKPTRISGTWIAVIVAIAVLALLLIFILQNLDPATVNFLGAAGSMPLAVAMLFAAIAGAALVALVGGARILQLRKQARRRHRR
ncbi:LapA family protein [Amycolatopsis panacis]|uniref:DUF1049 domain-containing protein n=1 Tax=Amycolatopsis panacis TaxID=2340917 RepID=A0A419I5E0_9PSEU|nr:lipopolysaccharide assembly protein LapA domain-containing protein [Amycolatopsis panacis]RJQ85985.1 DUF1049 domain-containing protein [Amycolatopsis panacis]